MLKQPTPSTARWIGGGTVVVVLALGVGFSAWSAQPKREVIDSNPLAAEAIAPTTSANRGFVLDNMVATAAPEVPPVPPTPPAPPAAMTAPAPAPPALPAAMVPPPPPALPKGRLAPLPPLPSAPSPAPEAGAAPAAPHAGEPPLKEAPSLAPISPHANVAPPASSRDLKIARMSAPVYPSTALIRGVGGKVVLLVDVDAQGTLGDVQVERSEPIGLFDQAAINAVKRWQFEPAIENGRPIASQGRVPVEFRAPVPVGVASSKFARKRPASVPTL